VPSLKAVQDQLGSDNSKIVYVFVSPRDDSFSRDCALLKQMGLIGQNHQWPKRTDPEYAAFFNTHPGDKSRWWVPTSMLLDPSGNVVKWWRGSAMDWRTHIEDIRALIATAR
jgi:hypothetical protein